VKRIQLFEFHDLAWFPQGWRDFMTEIMNVFDANFNPYAPVIPKLAEAAKNSGAAQIVDLCSGGGGTALRIQEYLDRIGDQELGIILTDRFPNLSAFREIAARSRGRITFRENAVDAMKVPADLSGFRTIFTSFHHFPPATAKEILQDAVHKHEGVGIFEYTENTWVWALALLGMPCAFFISAFMIKPFNWRRVIQAIILVPILAFLWDTVISCLRSYTVSDLEQMAAELDAGNYQWEAGRIKSFGGCYVTYLLGAPAPARK